LAVLSAGCGDYKPAPVDSPARTPAAPATEPAAPAAPPTAQPAAPPPQVVRQPAAVGVGERGRGYGDGPVATPVMAYFRSKERIAFEIQIPEAMKLYKAEHEHAPKTHAEFMKNIIDANHIALPTLPPRHRYVYDPKSEQLMVEH
jgi:hypothetical protein